MTSSKQFQIKVTAVRPRKAAKKSKTNQLADELENVLLELLTHPLLERLPSGDLLKTDIAFAVRDLAKGNY